MPAADALHVRTLLAEQLRLPAFQRLVDLYIDTADERRVDTGKSIIFDIRQYRRSWNAKAMTLGVEAAENFYVSPDMMKLALLASQDLPNDAPVFRQDQPSMIGFMLFGSPYRQLDVRGRVLVIHAVLWVNNRVWAFTDRVDFDDWVSRSILEDRDMPLEKVIGLTGRYDISAMAQFQYGAPLPKALRMRGDVLLPDESLTMTRNDDGDIVVASDHAVDMQHPEGPMVETANGLARLLQTVWLLMKQTLASVESEEPSRGARRRAQRIGIKRTDVSIIKFRRHEYKSHDGVVHPIDYRYPRRGHWRNVWCGPIDKPEERYRRPVYIPFKICGPEDAPLVIRHHVNALIR